MALVVALRSNRRSRITPTPTGYGRRAARHAAMFTLINKTRRPTRRRYAARACTAQQGSFRIFRAAAPAVRTSNQGR